MSQNIFQWKAASFINYDFSNESQVLFLKEEKRV
jgi:hypothetical protein